MWSWVDADTFFKTDLLLQTTRKCQKVERPHSGRGPPAFFNSRKSSSIQTSQSTIGVAFFITLFLCLASSWVESENCAIDRVAKDGHQLYGTRIMASGGVPIAPWYMRRVVNGVHSFFGYTSSWVRKRSDIQPQTFAYLQFGSGV
jgi:hypothetical protein